MVFESGYGIHKPYILKGQRLAGIAWDSVTTRRRKIPAIGDVRLFGRQRFLYRLKKRLLKGDEKMKAVDISGGSLRRCYRFREREAEGRIMRDMHVSSPWSDGSREIAYIRSPSDCDFNFEYAYFQRLNRDYGAPVRVHPWISRSRPYYYLHLLTFSFFSILDLFFLPH